MYAVTACIYLKTYLMPENARGDFGSCQSRLISSSDNIINVTFEYLGLTPLVLFNLIAAYSVPTLRVGERKLLKSILDNAF